MTAPRPALQLPGRVDGIDVSAVQSSIDYEAVAAAGFRFCVAKVSEGLTYKDPMASRHLAGFRAAGLYTLVYTFLHPSKGSPRAQVLNAIGAMGNTYVPIALDLETRDARESNAELVGFLEEACEAVREEGALRPLIYTFPWFSRGMQPELGRSRLSELADLWMACIPGPEPYTPSAGEMPYTPPPWTRTSVWQYGGDHGWRVPGIAGACDRDLFLGDEGELRRFLGLTDEATPTEVA